MLSKRMRDMLFGNNGTGRTFLHFVLLLLYFTLLYLTSVLIHMLGYNNECSTDPVNVVE